jgi:hypothetical protein
LRLVVRSPALVAARRFSTGERVLRVADRARMSSRVGLGYAFTRSASKVHPLSVRRISSTGIRVPRMTDLPSMQRTWRGRRSRQRTER